MYQKYFKRLLDINLCLALLLFLFPLIIIIFFLTWCLIGFPIFKHKRIGLNNKIFTMYKFRTMYDSCENISEKKRINSFGNFLRKTGIDELPQVLNVLLNEMSFVGPRPLLPKYLKIDAFKKHQRKKCKPGITGLAQVQNFANKKKKRRKSKWIEQFNLDKRYIQTMSLKLDVIILIKTFLKIFIYEKVDYLKEVRLSDRHFN